MTKKTMREALTEIARDVERTDVKDLHKIRRLASKALEGPDLDEVLLSIKRILENEDNSAADCYDLISAEFEEIGMPIKELNS
jgi:hypothetical protein